MPKTQNYSEDDKRKAMVLWCQGNLANDTEIAEAIGVESRNTIARWRRNNQPENWRNVKARMEQKASDKAVERVAGDLGQVQGIQLHEVRIAKARAMAELEGGVCKHCGRGTLEASTLEGVMRALVPLLDKEQELCGGPRQVHGHVALPTDRDALVARITERLSQRQLPEGDNGDEVVVEVIEGEESS